MERTASRMSLFDLLATWRPKAMFCRTVRWGKRA
jgi:hypothetical protein